MQGVDKNIEELIVRRLDAALSEEEALELDRELIRNPEARRLMEEYEKVDHLAAAALGEALGGERLTFDAEALPSPTEPRPVTQYHWGWRLGTGAIAAALLAIFVARAPFATSPTSPTVVDGTSQTTAPQAVPYPTNGARSNGLMRNVSSARPRVLRDTGREVFGVLGDDGNIYWIEVDRTRTTRVNPVRRRAAETL